MSRMEVALSPCSCVAYPVIKGLNRLQIWKARTIWLSGIHPSATSSAHLQPIVVIVRRSGLPYFVALGFVLFGVTLSRQRKAYGSLLLRALMSSAPQVRILA